MSYKFDQYSELADAFRTKQCCSVPKITQTGSHTAKMWTVKQ